MTAALLHSKITTYLYCFSLRCCSSAALAQSVGEGNPEEEDLFVVRAVLQLLAVGKGNGLDEKLEDAHELLQSYESMMRRGLPDTPLVHFINFLIKVSF